MNKKLDRKTVERAVELANLQNITVSVHFDGYGEVFDLSVKRITGNPGVNMFQGIRFDEYLEMSPEEFLKIIISLQYLQPK